MNLKTNCAGFLFTLLTVIPGVAQQDGPTALEKCRSILAADLTDAKAPEFSKYPAKTQKPVDTVTLDLTSSPVAKTYRTVLQQQMAEGTNYAGHYRLAYWGCGASCAMFAVIDLTSGKVTTAKEFGTVAGTHLYADDFLPGTGSDSWAFRYRNDSSLLVVIGAPDEDESRAGAYYFALQDNQLHLVHTTYANKRHCDMRLRKPS